MIAHPVLNEIGMAKMINQALGGPFVAPWEIDQLPDVFLDAIQALNVDLVAMRRHYQQVESHFEHMRREHPTYRKHN